MGDTSYSEEKRQRRGAEAQIAEPGQKASQVEMGRKAMTKMGEESSNNITLSEEQRSERLKQKLRADRFNAQAGKEIRPRAALDHEFAGKGFLSPVSPKG